MQKKTVMIAIHSVIEEASDEEDRTPKLGQKSPIVPIKRSSTLRNMVEWIAYGRQNSNHKEKEDLRATLRQSKLKAEFTEKHDGNTQERDDVAGNEDVISMRNIASALGIEGPEHANSACSFIR